VETYICIGKCVPTPASLSLSLPLPVSRSLPRTGPLSLLPPKPPRIPALQPSPRVPSHSRCSLLVPSIPQSLPSLPRPAAPRRPTRSVSRHPAFSLGVPPLVELLLPLPPTAPPPPRSFFLSSFFLPSRSPYFSSARPRGPSSDFYNLLLVAPRSTAGRHRVSGAAHPEKPENRGKQKRPARRASRRDAELGQRR